MVEERVALHEAGHALVAFTFRLPIRMVSIRPGMQHLGVMVPASGAIDTRGFEASWPAIAQPARLRRRVEAQICTCLAGTLAERMPSFTLTRRVSRGRSCHSIA